MIAGDTVAVQPPPGSQLPWPYGRWVEQWLGRAPEAESRADCARCSMCAGPTDHGGPTERILFDPGTRCCTYQPAVPNYLAGAALGATDEAGRHGRQTLRQRMARGDATMLGIRVPPEYLHRYRAAVEPAFGRARSLRCPHHRDDGGCGLWTHRPAVCATWFCKHERGLVGARQWRALNQVLAAVERAVSLWCLQQLGVPPAQQQAALAAHDAEPVLDAPALDGEPDGQWLADAWGRWLGREADFYAECAACVEPLDGEAVLAIAGREAALLAEVAVTAARDCADTGLPEAVRTGRFAVRGSHRGLVWIQGYSEFDPLAVSPEVLALVARCDGRLWSTVADEQAAAGGVRPSRVLLRTLLDHGILVPA